MRSTAVKLGLVSLAGAILGGIAYVLGLTDQQKEIEESQAEDEETIGSDTN